MSADPATGASAHAPTVRARAYAAGDKALWDRFVSESKNGVFLFYRDYLEYHADRFEDRSLLFFQGDRLVAIMPANVSEKKMISHGGLTFGGVISGAKMRTPLMMEIFRALLAHCAENGIVRIRYKAVPHIYHSVPAEEDLYALFLVNGVLVRRDVSSAIPAAEKPEYSKGRLWSVKKSRKLDLSVGEERDFKPFMGILEDVLQKKHGVKPVHTLSELEYLAGLFPGNIRLFSARLGGKLLAGAVIYESRNVAHVQYIASTDEGKAAGALDNLFDYLINDRYAAQRYFDFGISTEREGRYLNGGLVTQKEEFGARAVVYDTYEIAVE